MEKKKKILDIGNNLGINHTLRRICRRILFNNSDPPESILVTSSLSGEGNTTVSTSLAKCIAEEDNRKTLLIEGNLSNPTFKDYFDFPLSYGLTDVILKGVPLHKTTQITSIRNLHIMGAGSDEAGHPFDKIANFKDLLKEVKKEYDFIILDAPPVLESPETAIISQQFDGTLLIVQANRTIRADVERVKKEITESGGKILGIILNRKKQYTTKTIYRKYFGHDALFKKTS